MSITTNITLGGAAYTLSQFNIGQLERVTDLLDDEALAPVKRSFALMSIVLECVEPAVADPKAVRTSVEEIAAAITAAMRISGLSDEPQNPLPPALSA